MAHIFKKQFGQNFLRSDRFANIMVNALELDPTDTIIEVGPGEGLLTRLLISSGVKVISVEIDYSLLPNLITRFSDSKNFMLVNQDILETDVFELLGNSKFKVIGSLPYNISKKIIKQFITSENKPERMVVLVQEEVSKLYNAKAPKATFLSNWIKLYAKVTKLESVPASQFYPKPKVNGGILLFEPINNNFSAEKKEDLGKLLKLGFISPRKVLLNNLKSSRKYDNEKLGDVFISCDIGSKVRASELTFETWLLLFDKLKSIEL